MRVRMCACVRCNLRFEVLKSELEEMCGEQKADRRGRNKMTRENQESTGVHGQRGGKSSTITPNR